MKGKFLDLDGRHIDAANARYAVLPIRGGWTAHCACSVKKSM